MPFIKFNESQRMKIKSDNIELLESKIPHLLKYMGSKREIIDFVKESVNALDVQSIWLCDLFSGTGVVGGSFKNQYKVHANDIQAYSSVLAHTYLGDFKRLKNLNRIDKIEKQTLLFVKQFYSQHRDLNFKYESLQSLSDFAKIEKSQQDLIEKDFQIGFHLFTKFYSGTYWSFDQCVWIDSIRAVAEQYKGKPEYYVILSSLTFAMSYTSQSTGHYAQYRDAYKESSMLDIMVYRKKELWPLFEKKYIELVNSLAESPNDYKVTNLDYVDCLRIIEEGSIVYADPPYQSVHYSRFYHVLETLVKYDYPKVLYKGRYRDDRHQSPFCKKSTVDQAFKNLFEGVKFRKSHLVLSYSDTGMISLENIKNLGSEVFGREYKTTVLEKEHKHSNMGRSDQKEQDVKEYAVLFKKI